MSKDSIFIEKSNKMQAHLNSFIADGSDHELFIASYLHGHFDVAVANVEKLIERGEASPISTLQATLDAQLQEAFDNNELSTEDAGQVTALFNSLFIL
ncbi:YfcL family protein [Psychromonas ingrahamii]|nr:YfcL family protein [Psychromonas ingrahamii]